MDSRLKLFTARVIARETGCPLWASAVDFRRTLSHIAFIPSKGVPTVALSERPWCYYNPDFAASATIRELVGLLTHEALHIVAARKED